MSRICFLIGTLTLISAGVYLSKQVTTGEMDDSFKSSFLMLLSGAFMMLGLVAGRISRLEKLVQELRVAAAKA
jgi:hypothetical protein